MSMMFAPRNGLAPVTISYKTTPNENTSLLASTANPSNCSGLMYAAVPNTTPVAVSKPLVLQSSVWMTFAKPKSSNFTPASSA